MTQIKEDKVTMKPRSYFLLGSVFTFLGFTASIISSIFIISIISFLLKEHGPMGELRLSLMLNSFPWWLPILAVITLTFGIWNLLKYDFSYKTNFLFVIIGFIVSILIAAWLIDLSGIDKLWLSRGPLKNVIMQYSQGNNHGSNFNNKQRNSFKRGQIRNNIYK